MQTACLLVAIILMASPVLPDARQEGGVLTLIEHKKTEPNGGGYTTEKWVWTYIDPGTGRRYYKTVIISKYNKPGGS